MCRGFPASDTVIKRGGLPPTPRFVGGANILSKESEQAFLEALDQAGSLVGSNLDIARRFWDAALTWCRPLAIAAIKKAKATKKRQPKAPKETSRFVPPSMEQVAEYMKQQGFPTPMISAEKFVDHYETRGWVPKGYTRQMKSWKAAVRTWKHNGYPVDRTNGDNGQSESVEDQRKRDVTDRKLLAKLQRENDLKLGLVTEKESD